MKSFVNADRMRWTNATKFWVRGTEPTIRLFVGASPRRVTIVALCRTLVFTIMGYVSIRLCVRSSSPG